MQYVQAAVKNVEQYLANNAQSLEPKAIDVLPEGYCTEIDIYPELVPHDAVYFYSLIGVSFWMVDLGRVDSWTEVIMMSSCLIMTHKGHFGVLFRACAYLKKNHNAEMVFDPREPEVDMKNFPQEDWIYSIYGDAKEEPPPTKPFAESGPGDMPEPRETSFTMPVYVDCDIGGNCITLQSRTGYTVFLNGAPIY